MLIQCSVPLAFLILKCPNCARNTRIARPLTKPSITGWGTMRMNFPRRSRAKTICRTPISTTAAKRYCDAMLHHKRDHDHRGGTRRSRDHARPAAKRCGDEAHNEGRIKPNQRVDVGNQCKRNRFRNQRQRDRQTGQNICFRLRVGTTGGSARAPMPARPKTATCGAGPSFASGRLKRLPVVPQEMGFSASPMIHRVLAAHASGRSAMVLP